METMMDGTPFNPPPVCNIPQCVEKPVARLYERNDDRRKDLCLGHAKATLRVYKEESIEVIAVWNGITLEDLEDE